MRPQRLLPSVVAIVCGLVAANRQGTGDPTGLAAGILIDATVIRALLVPAVVSLFGRWNWWLPAGAARLLRVRPSPEPVAGTAGA